MADFRRLDWRHARKPHKCYLCGKEIQKGERYFYADGKADGVFFHDHYHESCEEILSLISERIPATMSGITVG